MRSSSAWRDPLDAASPQAVAGASARRGNRRRLLVFGAVFVVLVAAGQLWNWSRPAQYKASTRLQVQLPASAAAASNALAAETGLGVQVQSIVSTPMLQQLARRLAAAGQPVAGGEGDAVGTLRRLISAQRVADTEVLELRAAGTERALLAPALNELVATYRDQLLADFERDSTQQLAGLRGELARIEKNAAERRAQLERFRGRSGLVSTEREDAEAVARSRGLSTALNNALEKQAAADAKLSALKQAAAGGPAVRSKDDPTLSALETRASQLREEVREMERSFTPDFMAMDPRAKALRTRLAEMERQIATQRSAGQAAVLAGAQEDAAAAQAAVERLRVQLAQQGAGMKTFQAGFTQARLLEDDLAQVEKARREQLERLARLEAAERNRAPRIRVLEAAAEPSEPYAPAYWRDGALVVGAAFALGLVAMAFVELFNRPPPAVAPAPSTTVVLPHWNAAPGLAAAPAAALPGAAVPVERLAGPSAPPPRELEQAEAAALLAAAQGPTRIACAAALLGLGADELLALQAGDLDRAARRLQVGGSAPRRVPVPDWLADEVTRAAAAGDGPLLRDAAGRPLDASQLRVDVTCAAVDAGLPHPADVTPALLRHTCIAWLVGQGLRFAELPALVGPVDLDTVTALAGRVSPTVRRGAAEIEPMMPALRLAPPA